MALACWRDVLRRGREAQRDWLTPGVASRMRRDPNPDGGQHPTGWENYDLCGSIAVCAGFVFLAEGQGCGVRVYRASDGLPVGRMWSEATPNSTVDDPAAFCAWDAGSEVRLSVTDFNGSAAALWRVAKSELKRAAARADHRALIAGKSRES
jgi:hypothetical protein